MAKLMIFGPFLLGLFCIRATEESPSFFSHSIEERIAFLLDFLTSRGLICKQDGLVAIPPNCLGYISCIRGGAQLRKCPEGYKFDSVMYCTRDETADCGNRSTSDQDLDKLCLRDYDILVYPDDCHKFVACISGMAKLRTCPQGQVYQKGLGCLNRDQCPPNYGFQNISQRNDTEDFVCRESGRYANPNNCDSYIECSVDLDRTEMELVQCPVEQHYNMDTKRCEDKCTAQCDQDLACTCGWPHCSISCKEPNGVFPVPTNCKMYMVCSNNTPQVKRCREGKVFDPESRECVDIEETNCVLATNDVLSILPGRQNN